MLMYSRTPRLMTRRITKYPIIYNLDLQEGQMNPTTMATYNKCSLETHLDYTPRRPTSRDQTLFLGNCWSYSNFGHKYVNYKENTMKNHPKVFHGPTNRNQNCFEVLNQDIDCFVCHNFGHKAIYCRTRKGFFFKIKPRTRPLLRHGRRKMCGERSKDNKRKKNVRFPYKPIMKKTNGALIVDVIGT